MDLLLHLGLNFFQALLHLFRPNDVVAGREDGHMAHHIFMLARQWVKFNDAVDLVAKELYPDGVLVVVGQMNVHRIPFYAEFVADEVHIIALILQLDQSAAKYITLHLHTGAQADDHTAVVNGVAQRVYAGYRCYNNDIAPLRQCGCSRVAQAVDLVIDGAVLLYIGVGGRDISLWLVVVIVGDKILHRIIREKAAHLGTDLACQRFIRLQNQRGAVAPCNDVRHCEGLARACDTQQCLGAVALLDSLHQSLDCLWLIAGRLERCL